ncbi:hypothetical protein As57867_001559, partial [Aphanomyces stellatus]
MMNIMKRFAEASSNAIEIVQSHNPLNDTESDVPSSAADPPRSSDRQQPLIAPRRESTPPASTRATQRRAVPKGDLTMAIERFQYAMLLAERKSALGQLQTLWSEAEIPDDLHRMIIPVILSALVTDPRDTELMEAMLELMQSLVTMKTSNATTLLEDPHALDTILGLMQDPSPWIRGPTVQLIKKVQDGDSTGFATRILACQEGLRLLLEVVEDKREHIRDTAVQVLLHLTTNDNPMTQRHVQQFLAFEEGFARLFQIIDLELEGHGIESPVLIDCLQVILKMIQNNTMTQSLLRETPFVSVLFPLLLGAGLPDDDEADTAADDDNAPLTVHLPTGVKGALDILASLVGPVYADDDASTLDEIAKRDQSKRQDEMPMVQAYLAQQIEVVHALGELACHGRAEADRLHAMQVLHLLCQANEANQLMVLTLSVSGPAYVLSAFLHLDVDHEETPLGAAARTLLDCVWANELTKLSILQHIHAPPPHEHGPIETVGQALVKKLSTTMDALAQDKSMELLSLTSKDATKIVWKCCARWRGLLHNAECKQLALRVPGANQAHAVSGSYFLNSCLKWLMELSWTKSHYSLLLALFRLVVSWIQGCAPAVQEIVTSIPTLTFFCKAVDTMSTDDLDIEMAGLSAMVLGISLEGLDGKIQLTKEQLLGMITRQVGLQKFTDAFVNMQQVSPFRNLKRAPDGFVVYDKAFVQLYKHVAETTRVGVLNVYMGTHKEEDSRSKAYQDLIRMQDHQLQALQEQLKQKPGGGVNPLEDELAQANQLIADLKQTQQTNETRIRGLTTANDLVEKELQKREAELKRLKSQAGGADGPTQPSKPTFLVPTTHDEHELRVAQLEHDMTRLKRQLQEKDDEVEAARRTIDMLTAHQNLVTGHDTTKQDEKAATVEVEALTARVAALEAELQATKETHTLTVSTLVSRHEQQLKEEAGQAKAQLEHALAAQAKETLAKHDAEMAELAALEAELQATKETHTLTVSTLVSRHEQQLKEEAGQAKAQLE